MKIRPVGAELFHDDLRLHLSTRYSCKILIRLELPRQIFEKYSNINFNEDPSSGSRVVS